MTEQVEDPSDGADAARLNKRNVRGSTLLLVGRLVSLLFTVLTQIVIVRALSKSDYGVFAYAFTLTAAFRILLSLGQGRLLSRFMAKYEEERDYARMYGAILMAVGAIMVTATLLLAAMALRPGAADRGVVRQPQHARSVLLILMFLAPLNALDQVFVSIFAVFSKPTAIFFRKYLLTPALQLGVVVFISSTDGSVEELALGYVLSSAVGIGLYFWMFFGVMRDRGIAFRWGKDRVIFPFREVTSFSVPTLTTELVYLVTNTGSVIILGHYHGSKAVADFRAVLPAARLNQVVYQTFVTMFLPMTTRLHSPWRPQRRPRDLLAQLALPGRVDVPGHGDDHGVRPRHDRDAVRPALRERLGRAARAVDRVLRQHRPGLQRLRPAGLRQAQVPRLLQHRRLHRQPRPGLRAQPEVRRERCRHRQRRHDGGPEHRQPDRAASG